MICNQDIQISVLKVIWGKFSFSAGQTFSILTWNVREEIKASRKEMLFAKLWGSSGYSAGASYVRDRVWFMFLVLLVVSVLFCLKAFCFCFSDKGKGGFPGNKPDRFCPAWPAPGPALLSNLSFSSDLPGHLSSVLHRQGQAGPPLGVEKASWLPSNRGSNPSSSTIQH